MAREEHNYGFYEKAAENKWIDIHQSTKVCLENYLSAVLFKGDLDRCCYSKPDIAFRRRIEMLDAGKAEDLQLSPSTLNLPFLVFSQTGEWENDDRMAALQAGQMLHGQYDLNTYRKIRSRAVKCTYTATVFFSRRDDVRLAAQILNWEANPQGPALLYNDVAYKSGTISIPIFTTIDKVTTNPDYNELDWLEKQRIFPLEIEMTVRSYEVLFGNIDRVVYLPLRHYNQGFEPDPDTLYLTKEADLKFAIDKFDLDDDASKVDTESEEISATAKTMFEKTGPFSEDELQDLAKTNPNEYAEDILKGYFTDSTGIDLSHYEYVPELSTPTSAYVKMKLKRSDWKYFEKLKVLVPGHGEILIDHCDFDHVLIENLHPNSTYECKILTYSINGDILTFNFKFTTKEDPDDPAPTPERINKVPGLVGMHL